MSIYSNLDTLSNPIFITIGTFIILFIIFIIWKMNRQKNIQNQILYLKAKQKKKEFENDIIELQNLNVIYSSKNFIIKWLLIFFLISFLVSSIIYYFNKTERNKLMTTPFSQF
jgi:L-lactate permease